jgi:hypothetical protein
MVDFIVHQKLQQGSAQGTEMDGRRPEAQGKGANGSLLGPGFILYFHSLQFHGNGLFHPVWTVCYNSGLEVDVRVLWKKYDMSCGGVCRCVSKTVLVVLKEEASLVEQVVSQQSCFPKSSAMKKIINPILYNPHKDNFI